MVKIIFLFLISISLKVISANLDTELQSFLTSSTKKSFASKKTNAVQNLYKSYKNKFNRNFKTDREEKLRFSSFNDTLNAILDNHRQGPKTFTLGFNKFTLWTQDELDKIRNGIQLPQSIINETSMNATNGSLILNKKLLRIKRTVPDSYDLTTMVVPSTNVPYLSSAKNQGACGSCYAFAFITLLEYQCVTQFRINFKLSEQQVLDCSTNDRGCSGGHFINTFNYFKNNLWQANGDSYYSYRGDAGECAFKSWVSKVQFTSFDYRIIGENDATAMQEALVRYGPLWTSLFVGSQESSMYRIISAKFMSYKSGVFQITGCPKSVFNNNHAVAIVGYGIDADTNTPYWTVRNSWGSDWGDNGYFKIKRGDNMCGIEANVYYMGRNL